MENIQYRPLKKSDFDVCKKLINEAWNADSFIKNPAVLTAALDAYLRLLLLSATGTFAAVKDGEVIGIICGTARGQRRCFFLPCMLAALLRDAVVVLFAPSSDRTAVTYFMQELSYDRKLLAEKKMRYDAGINLFIVSGASRGHGLGKIMLNMLLDYFRSCAANRVYLFTDTWCNYRFYDRQGFTVAASCELPEENGAAGKHQIFLYEKVL